jgi:hypothetical protein
VSIERTIAWLAKLAIARNAMARAGEGGAGCGGDGVDSIGALGVSTAPRDQASHCNCFGISAKARMADTSAELIVTSVRLASARQIHAAIDLFHKGEIECAITLSAAGEGMLPPTDKPHFFQKTKELEKSIPLTEEGAKRANDIINWLKHGTMKVDGVCKPFRRCLVSQV